MSLYEDAYELYYRLRQLGYNVPIEFQALFKEIEEYQSEIPTIPRIEQQGKSRKLPYANLIKRIDNVEQPKLPTIDSIADLYSSKVKEIPKEPKRVLHRISNYRFTHKVKEQPEQKPLRKLRTNALTKVYNARYQQNNLNLQSYEQPKHKPIVDESLYMPLIRAKRKSWGGRSRIYNFNIHSLAHLRRSILARYKRFKLTEYETKGQDFKKLISTLRRGLSHTVVLADIKESLETPTAVYNMCFTHYYMQLVRNVFQQDIYDPMTKAQKRAFNSAWRQGHTSTIEIMRFMLIKLADYGGGDIRTSDPKAITRIVQGNNLAVRRCLANLKEIVTMGWEEYEQETKRELDSRSTTQGAFLDSEQLAKDFNEDLVHIKDIETRK